MADSPDPVLVAVEKLRQELANYHLSVIAPARLGDTQPIPLLDRFQPSSARVLEKLQQEAALSPPPLKPLLGERWAVVQRWALVALVVLGIGGDAAHQWWPKASGPITFLTRVIEALFGG